MILRVSLTLVIVLVVATLATFLISPFVLYSVAPEVLNRAEAKLLLFIAIDVLLAVLVFQVFTFIVMPSAMSLTRTGFYAALAMGLTSGVATFLTSLELVVSDTEFRLIPSEQSWPTVGLTAVSLAAAYLLNRHYSYLRMPDNYLWASKFG